MFRLVLKQVSKHVNDMQGHTSTQQHTLPHKLLCVLVKMDVYPTYEIVEIKILNYPTPLAFL